jgi:hypothetical protein
MRLPIAGVSSTRVLTDTRAQLAGKISCAARDDHYFGKSGTTADHVRTDPVRSVTAHGTIHTIVRVGR